MKRTIKKTKKKYSRKKNTIKKNTRKKRYSRKNKKTLSRKKKRYSKKRRYSKKILVGGGCDDVMAKLREKESELSAAEVQLAEENALRKLWEKEKVRLQEQLEENARLIKAFQERESDLLHNEQGDAQAIEELQHQINELHSDAAVHKEENARVVAEFERKEARFEAQEQNWMARIAELEEELENETQKVVDLVAEKENNVAAATRAW